MDSIAAILNRTDHPHEDEPLLERSRAAWDASLAAMCAGGASLSPDEAERLLQGMCRWRYHRVRCDPNLRCEARHDRRAAAYLSEAAARLVLLDWLGAQPEEGRAAWLEARARLRLLVSDAELRALVQFTPVDMAGAEALLDGLGAAWTRPEGLELECSHLAPVAHAVLVRRPQCTELPEEALLRLVRRAERWSRLCAARSGLRRLTSKAAADEEGAAPPPAAVASVTAWVRRRAETLQADSALKAVADALALDVCDPSALPDVDVDEPASAVSVSSAVTLLLQDQPPAVATAAADASKNGTRRLVAGELGVRAEALVAMSLVDYAARQANGVAWAASFTASDARPQAATRRLARYLHDRIVDPPPVLLVLDDAVWTVGRRPTTRGGAAFSGARRHGSVYEALAAWAGAARGHSLVGGRYSALLNEMLAPVAPERRGPIGLALAAIT